jgi:NADH:ubiquinone reductase (non-electrogenic)
MRPEKIIVVGFGWAGYSFLQTIDDSKYDVHVYSTSDEFLYTPGMVNNVIRKNKITIHEKELKKDITFHKEKVIDTCVKEYSINTSQNKIRAPIVIFAHGAKVNTFQIPGVEKYCYFFKTYKDLEKIQLKVQTLPMNSKIAIIGCGFTGSELVGNLLDFRKYQLYAIDGLPRPLPMFSEKLSQKAVDIWNENKVVTHFSSLVTKIDSEKIHIKDAKEPLQYNMAIWCGGLKIHPLSLLINKQLGLEEHRGIPVNKKLQIENAPKGCYAMGDCAITGYPPTAQVAYQQGIFLAKQLNEKSNKDFAFQDKGQIGYIGNGESVMQTRYFQGGGKIIGLLNQVVHAYNLWKLNR